MESTSCLLALKPSYYTIIVQYIIFTVRSGNPSSALWYSAGETPTFRASTFRALQVSPGKSTHILRTSVSPEVHNPVATGFREINLPISRPGLGKIPTRQSMSSLWSPGCLLIIQLGRVSPYEYEASPPQARL